MAFEVHVDVSFARTCINEFNFLSGGRYVDAVGWLHRSRYLYCVSIFKLGKCCSRGQ